MRAIMMRVCSSTGQVWQMQRTIAIKLFFSTNATDTLNAGETFQVKDLSVFELLKNLKDAFESDNSTWVSKNIQYIDTAKSLTTKNNAVIAFQGYSGENFDREQQNKRRQNTDIAGRSCQRRYVELATEFNMLLNTYQALLSTLARMQSVSILNYLK